ncbi:MULTISPECIES: hypothetical protein [Amycolatopsis]|uniref:Uncharacterized protein n=1 Tax=Amycolatopsis dendrobii TaxID=2760662 RepID=A0A7W3ZCC5_9PSEU|nr:MULTISPECIES: hypothetical protein [Amycolatopsis]MBB1155787.1 hypothetical protein [Amycolatopsis dendrobii]UKD52990.1 hypothetical protein L3Q65_34560 [Amycolatopsis sp. FU40]
MTLHDYSNAAHSPDQQNNFDSLGLAGPSFAETLRGAIDASGLTLERIRARLTERGSRVSLATLSNWQSGSRQPEQRRSIEAVRQLENVLELPMGRLSGRLGPPRPRGRQVAAEESAAPDEQWLDSSGLSALMTDADIAPQNGLRRISLHLRCHLDSDRAVHRISYRHVLLAEQDGISQDLNLLELSPGSRRRPTLIPTYNCRLGRQSVSEEKHLMINELLFDSALRRGETVVLEYEIELYPEPGQPSDNGWTASFRLPIQEFLIEARFGPGAVPVRCREVRRPFSDPTPTERPVRIGESANTHAVMLGLRAGRYGLEWDWPEQHG